jgi:hypothetical protein
MKRLIGATALATLGLSYSAQAAVEPEPGGEAEVDVEPEVVVWTGDSKDHIGYGPVVVVVEPEVVVWTGDSKDHIGYGPVVVVEVVRVERSCMGNDFDGACFVLETPGPSVRPCASGFVNRVPC